MEHIGRSLKYVRNCVKKPLYARTATTKIDAPKDQQLTTENGWCEGEFYPLAFT